MKATLSNYRQSPRKVRLVASLVVGKDVSQALHELAVLSKRAALPIKKLIESAVANASTKGMEQGDLSIRSLRVDKGVMFKRFLPKARGRATVIRKKASHLVLELGATGTAVQSRKKATVKKPAGKKETTTAKKKRA
ncbi:MAG: 50S ribosomal protein L22 [Minisyncoccota bacterium]